MQDITYDDAKINQWVSTAEQIIYMRKCSHIHCVALSAASILIHTFSLPASLRLILR